MAEYTLTVYDDDDATVLFEVGTAADHANPYLHVPTKFREASVDLLRGGAIIGQYNLRIIDPQTGATKAERWMTGQMGSATGHSALVRRRALFKRVDPDTVVIIDGVVGRIELSESFAGFHVDVKDSRERSRKVDVFARSGTTSIFPRGVVNGYGLLPTGDYLIAPTEPWPATARRHATLAGVKFDVTQPSLEKRVPPERVVTEGMLEAIEPETRTFFGRERMVHANVEVWWRDAALGDADDWKVLQNSARYHDPPNSFGIFETGETHTTKGGIDYGPVTGIKSVGYMDPDASATLPADLQDVEILVVYVGPPTELNPWHFEGTWGVFLRNLMRGDYGKPGPDDLPIDPRLRYDEAAVLAIDIPCRVRATSIKELREAIEELHKQIGAAPALNKSDAAISPIRYELPSSTAGLTVLDDSNCRPIPGWEHTPADAITAVEVKYSRDLRVPASSNPDGGASDLIVSKPITVRRTAPQSILDIMGEETLEIDAWAFRSIGGNRGGPAHGSVADEMGSQLAEAAKDRALDRFVFGGSRSACEVMTSVGLSEGQWILDERPWRPNLRTNQRGGSTLAQVVSIRRLNEAWEFVQLVDAAPDDGALLAPTLGALSVDADNILTIPVTALPEGYATVQYAVNGTEPAEDSPLWRWAGQLEGPDDIEALVPPDETVWVRARARYPGRIPSAWVSGGSIATNPGPVLVRVAAEVDPDDGSVNFAWDAPGSAGGVRIEWVVHDTGTEAPAFTDSEDVGGGAERHSLDEGTVLPGQTITAELTPYQAFAAGSVSGAAGDPVEVSASRPVAETERAPTVDVTELDLTGVLGTFKTRARLKITGTAGEGGRTPLEYSYRITNGLLLPGTEPEEEWSAWAELNESGGAWSANVTVSRRPEGIRLFQARVRDADGRESGVVGHVILPIRSVSDGAGSGYSRGNRDLDRLGMPGPPGDRSNAAELVNRSGSSIVADGQFTADGILPAGTAMDDAEEYAERASVGLETGTGIVAQDVPTGHAAANLTALEAAAGRIDDTETMDGGGLPIGNTDPVADLADGPDVTDGADRARAGLTVSTGIIALDVPTDHAAANLAALEPAVGAIDDTVAMDGGGLPVGDTDPVSTLSDGADVTDGADRARAGLTVTTGVVSLDVPTDHAASNLVGLENSAGRLDTTENTDSGNPPVDAGDDVATLADGATVTEHADRAGTGLVAGTGIVALDVPVDHAAANLDALEPVAGTIDDTVAMDGGGLPVGDTDPVSTLADGADVTDGADRARAGLTVSTGIVALDIPTDHAAANLGALEPSLGRLDPTEPVDGGSNFPVDTGDDVATLADGPSVVSNAEAGASADTDLTALQTAGDIDRLTGRVMRAQSTGQNLLGTDAGPEVSSSSFEFKILSVTLEESGKDIGNRISASLGVKSATGTDRARVVLRFLDAGDSVISDHTGSLVTQSSYGERSVVEGVEIPAGTVTIQVRARNPDLTEEASARRAMLNAGTKALEFEEPPFRANRETAEDISETSGRNFVDGTFLDVSRRIVRVYSSAGGFLVNPDDIFGSATQLSSQTVLPMITAGNQRSFQWDFPGDLLSATNAGEIDVASHQLRIGGSDVVYNSGNISGLSLETTYYVYADDPTYAGGAVTYVATTDPKVVVGNTGRYYVGRVTTPGIGEPASGGHPGGGGIITEQEA